MGVGTSSVLGPPMPPPHSCGSLFRFGTTEAYEGAPPLWEHRAPPPPLKHGRWDLLCFATTEAPCAWPWGLLRFGTT